MKLDLPNLIRELDAKSFAAFPIDAPPRIMERREQEDWRRKLLPRLHNAQKFIFDSGSDQDPETIAAIRETAVNMMDAGLFRLPAPVIWIEDPFDDTNSGRPTRNFYLCEEQPGEIRVTFMQRMSALMLDVAAKIAPVPEYIIYTNELRIVPELAKDAFEVVGLGQPIVEPILARTLGECIYSVKKFLVTLATPQAIRERVDPAPRKRGEAKPRREYSHTVIRIPSYVPEAAEGGTGAPPARRRCHLVRGFMWGKNTRPLTEQRWVAPYWRGDASLGIAARSHYTVKGKPA